MSSPSIPSLEPVFSITAKIGQVLTGGTGAHGERLHIPIVGGSVSGERLRGKIVPGGSDWPVIGTDGHSRISAHYTIVADDGTAIYVTNEGLRVSPPKVLARLRAKETVAPAEYYFRTVPKFDVGDGPHQWLREHLFIGSAAPDGDQVKIDVYVVR